ncbi:hypothetical protein SLS56_004286 [Neofusicoccum ribis]|uniref:Uncharacterized protein n=1 Tax=Neofusicoccum ribis TaxID=45134 RepID=A0ABR3SWN7_9PEZI
MPELASRTSADLAPTDSAPEDFNWNGPANATLGFGAIIVVSGPGSPRRPKIIQAANVTEIDLTIPEQPEWTDAHLQNFTDAMKWGGRETGRGSQLAWLSHDFALKCAWDMIWIGHCGDWFHKLEVGIGKGFQDPSTLASLPHKIFNDSSLPDRENLHPFTKDLLDALEFPEKTRTVHQSVWPLCTFGYGVNRHGAARIIGDIAPIDRPEMPHYDEALLHGCMVRGLQCLTVNPELMHHMTGDSIIAQEDSREEIFLPPVDAKGLEQSKERQETSNIECGFWSGDFQFDSEERLQMLREEVGRKGRCLKPSRKPKTAQEPEVPPPNDASGNTATLLSGAQ